MKPGRAGISLWSKRKRQVIQMPTGTVKWFDPDKGFGFIETDDEGKDLFVHFSQIADSGGFRTLEEGQRVQFDVTDSPKGLQASNVGPE